MSMCFYTRTGGGRGPDVAVLGRAGCDGAAARGVAADVAAATAGDYRRQSAAGGRLERLTRFVGGTRGGAVLRVAADGGRARSTPCCRAEPAGRL